MPVVFIHGVTVRADRWPGLLEDVTQGLSARLPLAVAGVYWGNHGSSLAFDGASIPDFLAGARGALGPADDPVELTALLLEDPLFELELLAGGRAPTGAASALAAVDPAKERRDALLRAVTDPLIQDLTAAIPKLGGPPLDRARIEVVVADSLKLAEAAPPEVSASDLIDPLTRAITAGLARASAGDVTLESSFPWSTAEPLVQARLEHRLGGQRNIFGRAAAGLVTLAMRRGLRRKVMQAQSLFIGDVLRYMTHRVTIQAHVAAEVRRACHARKGEDLWLVGHSLGGVIAFEHCLATKRKVTRLVTVGSQVGLLAELGALQLGAVGASGKYPAPPTTTTWRNVFSHDDMLSFLVEPAFEGSKDVPINTGAPFPLSHSDYWNSDAAYDAIAG